jgi:hypothetical protein
MVDKVNQLKLPFINSACEECSHLRKEIASLKKEVARHKEQLKLPQTKEKHVSYIVASNVSSVIREDSSTYLASDSSQSAVDAHIKLFRDLFIGRQDVYAERWQAKDGRSNYSPAKAHDWDKHVIDPKTKRKICSRSCKLLPVTDKVIAEHLSGKRIIGTYPLMQDDNCRFLVIDFDKSRTVLPTPLRFLRQTFSQSRYYS